jgi:hypothetical protein
MDRISLVQLGGPGVNTPLTAARSASNRLAQMRREPSADSVDPALFLADQKGPAP